MRGVLKTAAFTLLQWFLSVEDDIHVCLCCNFGLSPLSVVDAAAQTYQNFPLVVNGDMNKRPIRQNVIEGQI